MSRVRHFQVFCALCITMNLVLTRTTHCRDEALPALITPTFIKCLGNNSNKQTYLNKASKRALQMLSERVKKLPSNIGNELTSKISSYSGNQLGHYFKNSIGMLVRSTAIKLEVYDACQCMIDAFCLQRDDKSVEILSTIVEGIRGSTASDRSYVHQLPKIPGIVKKFQHHPEACVDLFKSLIDAHLKEVCHCYFFGV